RRASRPGADHREVPVSDAIAVVGSVAFDTIETESGRAERELGGAATHFAVAASYFAPVHVLAVVGDGFPAAARGYLASRNIDLSGLETRPGRTMYWRGRYHEDMNVRDTLDLDLGVFDGFQPSVGDAARRARYVFLGNIAPDVQGRVLDQIRAPALVGLDTIRHWIDSARQELEGLLPRIDLLVVNDEEARLISGEANVPRAARRILERGTKSVLVKR